MVPCGLGYRGRFSVAQESSSSIALLGAAAARAPSGCDELSTHTIKRQRTETLPDQTVHSRHLHAWKYQVVEFSKQAEAHFSQPRFGTN